jgi:hypothetical protein
MHQGAKGLPQDGAHAGGQTYDSSKRRETTSNHLTTIRPRPTTTSTVPEVSSLVDAGAFHVPDVCERAGMSWVFRCTRERIQPRGPRGSSLRNLIDRLPLDPRGGRRKLDIAPDGREQAKRRQQRRLHPKCAPRVRHGLTARREAAGVRHQTRFARNSYPLTVALPGRKSQAGLVTLGGVTS